MTLAHINRIATALPPFKVHNAFVGFVAAALEDPKARRLFERMVARSGIEERYSFLEPVTLEDGTITDRDRFYGVGDWPTTEARMLRYEACAPGLALQAIEGLGIEDPGSITHLIVASCTGFVAPGIDQRLVTLAGLDPGVERTVVGFMGCYAAVNALRLAHHIVRSTPAAKVLVVNLELCTLHFQRTGDLERLLAMLLFGDGCGAALVSAEPKGIALHDFRAVNIDQTSEAMTWRIGDQGFDMHLGGEVPIRIGQALARERAEPSAGGLLRGRAPEDYSHWAVHAGGRSILDAVQQGLDLSPDALDISRDILRDYGNLSSATLMFVLKEHLRRSVGTPSQPESGFAVAFGPGLAAESFRFSLTG
jgi:predicted naringenin-chalcone synthase